MSRRIVVGGLAVIGIVVILAGTRHDVLAQTPAARADAGDAAVTALIAELRALRADLAAASRNQLRAQLLLGRVQMQEQRLAYLDKQRNDVAAQIMAQSQMASMFRNQMGNASASGCTNGPAEQRRDCEQQVEFVKRQLADQEAREQQLRNAENELTRALSDEQARWSDFNSRLDELERTIR